MNEELKAKLIQYLNDVESAAKVGKDFLIEQAPLYVQELIAWEFCFSVCCAFGFTVLLMASLSVLAGLYKYRTSLFAIDSSVDIPATLALIFSVVAVMVSIPGIAINGTNAMKIKIAPRVVIVEKLQEMVH